MNTTKVTYDDFGEDFGLAEGFEEEREESAEEEDQGGLDYEQREGVVEGIIALPNSIGGGSDGGYIYSHSEG
ncbi:hypothetical protein RHGRI_015190 [Rhododendron griersonianum]|uniref:Uncharacterized protein n=1 Tax=Rhododendron griersonianum TaxID=479676 RepID=A0AAV6KCC6_9ERIC|nr:hypothetical protein RHGRI_015190 [Rhododendron griersonianum]